MADAERLLISRVLHKPTEYGVLADKQVTASLFFDTKSQEAFAWIREFTTKYGAVPSLDRFEEQFPEFDVVFPKQILS